jgi:hypothetical protein
VDSGDGMVGDGEACERIELDLPQHIREWMLDYLCEHDMRPSEFIRMVLKQQLEEHYAPDLAEENHGD